MGLAFKNFPPEMKRALNIGVEVVYYTRVRALNSCTFKLLSKETQSVNKALRFHTNV